MRRIRKLVEANPLFDKHGIRHDALVDEETGDVVATSYDDKRCGIVSDWEETCIRCDCCGTDLAYKDGIIFCPECEAEYDKDYLEAITGGEITITMVGPGGSIDTFTL